MKLVVALVLLVALVSSSHAYLNAQDTGVVKSMMKSMPALINPFGGYLWDPNHLENACCFTGIICKPAPSPNQACNAVKEEQWISELDMQKYVGGSFPENFGDLKNLSKLTMTDARPVGPLPDSFSKLTNLESLEIWGSQPFEVTPLMRFPDILTLKSLKRLDLHAFTVDEPLPEQWALHPSLETLLLTNGNIQGTIPASWNNWKNLKVLNLGNNQLKGQIPGFTGSPKLQDVSLYGNQLSGGLPSPFAPELQVIDFSHNFLTGTIPPTYQFRLTYLSNNSLVGTIPDVYQDVLVEGFIVSHNKLTGTVPRSLMKEQELMGVLNLSYNHLQLCPVPSHIDLGANAMCDLTHQVTPPSCMCTQGYAEWCKWECTDSL